MLKAHIAKNESVLNLIQNIILGNKNSDSKGGVLHLKFHEGEETKPLFWSLSALYGIATFILGM